MQASRICAQMPRIVKAHGKIFSEDRPLLSNPQPLPFSQVKGAGAPAIAFFV